MADSKKFTDDMREMLERLDATKPHLQPVIARKWLVFLAESIDKWAEENRRLREACELVLRDVGNGGPCSDYVSMYTVGRIREALKTED